MMESSGRPSRRVVLLGWDAADWNLLSPLIDAGLMPNLRSLIERGVMGKMATMQPALSPLLWTSAVTGMKPDRHGILGFLEPDPLSGRPRLITSTSRKVKAIWNILHQAGLRSLVVNWFASHPAEPINGTIVSDLYPKAVAMPGEPWPISPGSVHPHSLAQELAKLRVHPADITGDDLLPFIPQLRDIDSRKDGRPGKAARILAENISTHAAATWLMEHEEWDFLAVFYDMIDHFGHLFMQFHPPAMPDLPEEDCIRYKDAMTGVCCFHDLMLGRIIQLAGPDATIIVMSDHGLHTDHLRPTTPALFALETPALLHRSHGIFCMAGPGIRHDELVFGAELVDITPTILTLLDVPSGKDMKGRVLAEAFEKPPRIDTIPSWEEVPGDCGSHSGLDIADPLDATLAIRQLAELGYIENPDEQAEAQLKSIQDHYDFNLARVYLAAGRPADALPVLKKLVEHTPEELAFQLYLAQCYSELGLLDDCRATAEAVYRKDPNRPAGGLILANLHLAEGHIEEGLLLLMEAEKSSRPAPGIRYLIARTYLGQKRYQEAARAFDSVIGLDPDHAQAHAGLAQALLGQTRYQEAAETALDAIRLQFDLPEAHYSLGIALARTGRRERAMEAFETCLRLRPENPEPARCLSAMRGHTVSKLQPAHCAA